MDFDEYEYLEKTVENPEPAREKRPADGDQGKGSKRQSDESDLDHARRSSRRARSEGASAPRDEDDDDRRRDRKSSRHHRSSSEHRSGDGERREKDRHRERERYREPDREAEGERERERERSRRSRSRSERYYDEYDRQRERSRETELREWERSRRSRSRSERYYDEYDRYRERSRERELRERDSRRYREKEEVAEPEADPERDQRTVFAYQINLRADERDVYEFFSRAGKVRDVRLIMDRNSRRSKGVGYIEFYDVMSVPMAIALSGQKLLGQPVMIKPSEAEKNLVQSTTTTAGAAGALTNSGVARRLYVGNLHLNMTDDQLRQVFEPFGTVELVQLPIDPETRQCKGYGFIQFARLEDARAAQSLNGQLEIAGKTIKVSAVSEHVGMQDVSTNAGDFDDDGGLALNARSRALLMQKLDRSGIVTSVASSLVTPVISNPALNVPPASVLGAPSGVAPLQPFGPALVGPPGAVLPAAAPAAAVPQADYIGIPSECLLLKNMFDPSVETEPDFDLDIKEDVQDECSKYGTVKHVFVDKNTAGFVYLRFDNVTSAINAQRALHGRWFAGKMISATFMLPQSYNAKFPASG